MAEKIGSVWAVDIGNTSLKALRLSNESGALEVTGFEHIHHQKVLSGSGIKDQEKRGQRFVFAFGQHSMKVPDRVRHPPMSQSAHRKNNKPN